MVSKPEAWGLGQSQEGRSIEREMGEEKRRPKAFRRSGSASWGSKETGRAGQGHSRPGVGVISINPGRLPGEAVPGE